MAVSITSTETPKVSWSSQIKSRRPAATSSSNKSFPIQPIQRHHLLTTAKTNGNDEGRTVLSQSCRARRYRFSGRNRWFSCHVALLLLLLRLDSPAAVQQPHGCGAVLRCSRWARRPPLLFSEAETYLQDSSGHFLLFTRYFRLRNRIIHPRGWI